DDHPAERGASLTAAQESRCYDLLCSSIQIIALHDNRRIFAAKLQLDLRHALRTFCGDANTHGGRTCETDASYPYVRDQLFSTFAGANHQVENAGWQAGLLEQACDVYRGPRRQRGWFEYDSVPTGQSRGYFPHRAHYGKVPRGNRSHHADRLQNGVAGKPGTFAGKSLSRQT